MALDEGCRFLISNAAHRPTRFVAWPGACQRTPLGTSGSDPANASQLVDSTGLRMWCVTGAAETVVRLIGLGQCQRLKRDSPELIDAPLGPQEDS